MNTVEDEAPKTAEAVAEAFAEEIDDLIVREWDFHFGGQSWSVAYAEEFPEEVRDDPPLVLVRDEDGARFEIVIYVTAKEYPAPEQEQA